MSSQVRQIEARNVKLRECLQFLAAHTRFSYVVPNTRFFKTFEANFPKPYSAAVRWHVMSVDWANPWSSIWTAMWHISDNVSKREYLELLPLTLRMDEEYRQDGPLPPLKGTMDLTKIIKTKRAAALKELDS